ncbi:dynein axonemal intermediate chain 4-like, partial [Stomoxys calcitrans]|uniref:dynein axonemal intermediate chain 4-like n=1 Tax=Stomoxys calcitrans TaxID=35570 RepID=UPI0027E21F9B
DVFDPAIQKALKVREHMKVFDKIEGQLMDVTPKPIETHFETEQYKKLTEKARAIPVIPIRREIQSFKSVASSLMRTRSSRGVQFHLSMENIVNGIGSERMLVSDLTISPRYSSYIDESSSSESLVEEVVGAKFRLPYIRVVLSKTDLILLYEQQSNTACKDTEDGNFTEEDNARYDYLTIGRGKVRRRSDAETQTPQTLYKSRKINTTKKEMSNKASYVSIFEMYDTYRRVGEEDPFAALTLLESTAISKYMSKEAQCAAIVKLPSFQWVSMVIRRLLSGNNFEKSLRRYRNMEPIKPTVTKMEYKYSLKNLFTFLPHASDKERRAVSDMSFCYANNDILAVSYGIYSYQAAKMPETGQVCIWSIKNPCDPEGYYFYNYPAVAVEFSPYMPNLLAIGLLDGYVEVRDISDLNKPPIATSQRLTSPSVEPILALKWIRQDSSSNDANEIDPFLSLSQDGTVTRFHIIRGPHLLGFTQMVLDRIEGKSEGLAVSVNNALSAEANARPHCMSLTKHPLHADIYYILTDEGCIHKCATSNQMNCLEVLKTHKASVNCMDFSPWSPKLFLTCGNDWYIRIWLEGIFKPVLTLHNMYGPYQWAGWSRTHSTIIVALNRKQCEIWDLRRSSLKPMAIHTLQSSYNTMALYSRDGNSLAIGNERGKVFVLAFDDMPFPTHYPYDTLEEVIEKAVINFPDLHNEVKSLGYFGYPKKGLKIPP